jgi:hypothetical protein
MALTPIQRQVLHYLQDAIPMRRPESLETLNEQLHIAPLLLRTTVHAFIRQGYIGVQQMPDVMALYLTSLGETAIERDRDASY